MKKRLISLLLIAAMVIAIFPIGISAATETVDGVKYTVVSTAAELYGALCAGGNVLLENDIALNASFAQPVSILPGTLLDGNGYALTDTAAREVPLFRFAAGTTVGNATSHIRNLAFGTKDAPIKLKENGSLFTAESADTAEVVCRNVDFYVQGKQMTGSKVGAIYSNLNMVASFYGCSLYADLTSATSQNIVGGWIGEIRGGDLIMTDCATYGSITANAAQTAGFVGQVANINVRFTNCTNLASISGTSHVAGFVGNVGTGAGSLYFTSCKNFGAITSEGNKYDNMAGGLIGRATNKADDDNQRLRVFYDCINYGAITSGGRAGGLVGSSHDYDTNGPDKNYLYYTFENCINHGAVSGDAYAGGIIGVASPVTYRAELTDCINVGKITSPKGYAGNFAGMLSSGVVTGGYAAGVISTKEGSDVLAPHNSGNYTLQAGSYSGKSWAIVAPIVSDVKYIGSAQTVGAGITRITSDTLSAALRAMSESCGVSFTVADASNTDAYVVAAAPRLRGLQSSVATRDGVAELRFVAGVDAIDAYRKLGFRITVHAAAGSVTTVQTTGTVYQSICDASGGAHSALTADGLASKYLFCAVVSDVSLSEATVIEVTPYAVATDGTEYVGTTRVVSCQNGRYCLEPLVLNDVLLEDYVIVYASSNGLCEELLANRLSDELAKLTGIALPVLSDLELEKTTRASKILIGKTLQNTVVVSGRTLTVQSNDPREIVIAATTATQLSESIDYFIDTVEEKMLTGVNSWKFESAVSVPVDTTVSLMAYNMGAKDNADIKRAEWELIVDYLPDIVTFQEPGAAYLDDFLNDYAVQPTVDFRSKNTQEMEIVYNGTGDGYYGVYWGEARYKPGDACTNGSASYSIILYARDRFTVDESKSGTFWLSDKPNTSGTIVSGSRFTRCATYATMTDLNTGKTFVMVNVHLDYVSTEVQLKQLAILLQGLKVRVGTDLPIFITGDMNAPANSATIATYKENEIMPMTPLDEMADYTYRQSHCIDWLFINQPEKIDVSYYNNCCEHTYFNNHWNSSMVMGMPSDHPAIYSEFQFR